MPTYDLEAAAAEFNCGHYKCILAVRGVYSFDSAELDRPWDDYVADILIRHGVPPRQLHSVLFPGMKRDRTFASALAIKEWYRQNGLSINTIDLATVGPHSRRSRLLYQEALGRDVKIGVIALDDPSYDSRRWWDSSEGIRDVLLEGVAYFYVKLLFSPPQDTQIHLLPSDH
jgi:hypothetical protein